MLTTSNNGDIFTVRAYIKDVNTSIDSLFYVDLSIRVTACMCRGIEDETNFFAKRQSITEWRE